MNKPPPLFYFLYNYTLTSHLPQEIIPLNYALSGGRTTYSDDRAETGALINRGESSDQDNTVETLVAMLA